MYKVVVTFVYVCVYMQVCVCVHVFSSGCYWMWREETKVRSLPQLSTLLRKGFSLILEITDSARLAIRPWVPA